MKHRIMAICDKDERYLELLQSYLLKRKPAGFDIMVFSNLSQAITESKKEAFEIFLVGESVFDIKDNEASPEDSLIAEEKRQLLYKGIARLKNEQKQIIVLRDINGFSYAEIAQILKCTEGTVKSRISRAREALKNILISSGYFNG